MIGKLYGEKLVISPQDLKLLCFSLFKKIASTNAEFDYIIGIATGGYIIAKDIYELYNSKTISQKLGLRYSPTKDLLCLRIKSYSLENSPEQVRILSSFSTPIKGKKVLVVDDVSDRGETFHKALNHIKKMSPLEIKTASLHIKEGTTFIPDFFEEKISKEIWIVYPFEKEFFELNFP